MMKNWHKVSLVYRVYQSKPFSSPESVKTVRWEVCVYGWKDFWKDRFEFRVKYSRSDGR